MLKKMFVNSALKWMTWVTKNRLVIVFLLLLAVNAFAFSTPPSLYPLTGSSTTLAAVTQADDDSFIFIALGDCTSGEGIYRKMLDKINQESDIAFVVNLGDFVYQGRDNEYRDYLALISGLKPKIYHVPGNHDLVGPGERNFKKYFGKLYYSFDYKNTHFIVLNNAFKKYFDKRQFNWLRKDLANTKKEHIVVLMHRPTFDPANIFDEYVMSGREVVKQLMELFEQYGVDYVITGHLHCYAKTKRNGIVYLVSGGAGSPLHLPEQFGGFYHYVKIKVDGSKIYDKVVRADDEF